MQNLMVPLLSVRDGYEQQHPQHVHHPQHVQNAQNVQNTQDAQDVQNVQDAQNAQNAQHRKMYHDQIPHEEKKYLEQNPFHTQQQQQQQQQPEKRNVQPVTPPSTPVGSPLQTPSHARGVTFSNLSWNHRRSPVRSPSPRYFSTTRRYRRHTPYYNRGRHREDWVAHHSQSQKIPYGENGRSGPETCPPPPPPASTPTAPKKSWIALGWTWLVLLVLFGILGVFVFLLGSCYTSWVYAVGQFKEEQKQLMRKCEQ